MNSGNEKENFHHLFDINSNTADISRKIAIYNYAWESNLGCSCRNRKNDRVDVYIGEGKKRSLTWLKMT